jgi:DNA repair exonuclease SbcCD ATPase subunit
MFNQNIASDTKIAVLEERLSSYELLLKKIDEAIQIMGKTSQNISKMLAVHDEKIEQCGKTDEMIAKMIGELKEENKTQHKNVSDKIKDLESKIEELAKFRWIILGAAIIISFAVSQSSMVVDILTPDQEPARIEIQK